MSKSKTFKTIIEIEHSSFTDVSRFVQSLRTETVKINIKKTIGSLKYSILNYEVLPDTDFENVETPRGEERIINGKLCEVFQSKINYESINNTL